MENKTEQLEAEMRQMTPADATKRWEDRVRLEFVDDATHRSPFLLWTAALSAAACVALLLCILVSNFVSNNVSPTGEPTVVTTKDKDSPRTIGTTDVTPSGTPDGTKDAATIELTSGWYIDPTGDAVFTVLDDGHIKLDRGELLVYSAHDATRPLPADQLIIETPEGQAVASGTRFFIGSHQPSKTESPTAKSKGTAMNRITRVLVLAGVVTLTNPLGSVTGHANDLLAAESEKAPTQLTVQSNSDFAIDLYKQLAKENQGKNLFFSPYSITGALAMTAEGARGNTALEMGKTLRYPDAAARVGKDAQLIPWQTALIHTGFQQINKKLHSDPNDPKLAPIRKKVDQLRKDLAVAKANTKSERDYRKRAKLIEAEKKIADELNKLASQLDQFELNVANALWGEQTYRIEQPYRDTIAKFYDSGTIEPANFKGNFEGERVRINSWVEDQTKNRIKNLIPQGGLNKLTRLVLVNAIYFKGDWDSPFKERMTKSIDFTLPDGKKIKAKTMQAYNLKSARYGAFNADGTFFKTPHRVSYQKKVAEYPGKDGLMIAELPYKGKELSMVLIAPMQAGNLDAIEENLTSAKFTAWMAKLEKRKVHVKLPKFKMETEYQLHKTLPKMGMVQAFVDPREPNGADFTGMHSTSNRMDRLYISKVFHKAFVEVNEKGTEAAAATAVVMAVPTSAPLVRDFTPSFSADRPFITIIRHNETGAILFMGRVTDPTKAN